MPGDIKRRFYTGTFLLLIMLICGCLETPQVSPATIDENILETYGWSMVSIEEKSFEQQITNSTSIALNSSTVKYHNDRLSSELDEQVLQFSKKYSIPMTISLPDTMSAQIVTYRLSLPSGASLPSGLVSKIMDSKIDEIETSDDVENIQQTNTRNLILNDGTKTVVKIFSASSNSTGSGMKMMGFVTAFENDDSSTIVVGYVPDGEYTVNIGSINDTVFSINGESEIDEMLELVSTIE